MRSTRQVLDATLQTPEQAVRQELVLCWALRFGRESHFSQARIQGQEIKKNTHTQQKRLLGSYSNKPGGRAAPEQRGSRSEQSRTLAALGEQPAPKLGTLRSNINFLELRTLLSQPVGNTGGNSSPSTGSSRFHKPRAATPATRNAKLIYLSVPGENSRTA